MTDQPQALNGKRVRVTATDFDGLGGYQDAGGRERVSYEPNIGNATRRVRVGGRLVVDNKVRVVAAVLPSANPGFVMLELEPLV